MFWIYGGALQFGNAGQPIYDGSSLAAYEDIVVVTANYRTNVFGFPNSPELPMTGQNLGFLDQRLALQWVQSNILSFGGNPQQVTIFGESAGAQSVDALVTSYSQSPPFRAAILESGQASIQAKPTVNSTQSWYILTSQLNCPQNISNLDCVRKVPTINIKSILEMNKLSFSPVPDQVTLMKSPSAQRKAGNIANVPLLLGTNNNEGSTVIAGETDLNLTTFLAANFGTTPALMAALAQGYRVGTTTSKGFLQTDADSIDAIYTDYLGQCVSSSTSPPSGN
jgi:carboxylesterase type B